MYRNMDDIIAEVSYMPIVTLLCYAMNNSGYERTSQLGQLLKMYMHIVVIVDTLRTAQHQLKDISGVVLFTSRPCIVS